MLPDLCASYISMYPVPFKLQPLCIVWKLSKPHSSIKIMSAGMFKIDKILNSNLLESITF